MPTFLSVVDAAQGYRHGPTTPVWKTGTGTPQGVVAAPVGSLYSRLDGGTDTAVYRKEAGTDANGWVAVTNSGTGGGLVTSVDGRTGVVTLDDKYVDITGDTMTGALFAPGIAIGTDQLGYALNVNRDSTPLDPNPFGQRNYHSWTASTNTSGVWLGAMDCTMVASSAAGTTFSNPYSGAITGLVAAMIVDGAGSFEADAAGIIGSIERYGGPLRSGTAVYAKGPNLGGGTIDLARGVQIGPQKISGVTSGYGIFQEGTNDLNFFAGQVQSPSFRQGGSGPTWTSGSGSPETVIVAPIGSIYSRTDGGADTAVYRKESGAAATGWVATSSSAGGVTSVDGRTGVVTLADKYVDVTGDTMTGALTVNTNTYVDGFLTVGAGFDPNLRLQVRNTTAHTTSLTGLGGRISTIWSGSGALSNVYLRGLDAMAQATLAAGGTYTNGLDTAVVALFGISQMDGDGAYSTWANGVAGRVTRNGAGNLTNAVALNANYPAVGGGGSITNAYGLYVGPQKAAGVTNGYGVYQAGGSDVSYFGGRVSIGTTDFGYALHVNRASTVADSNPQAQRVYHSWTATADTSGVYASALGATMSVSNNAGNTFTNNAGEAIAGLGGTGLVTGAGTFSTYVNGVIGSIAKYGTSTLSDGRAIYAAGPWIAGGTITTATGVDIGPQKIAGVTNGFGIYQRGASDLNYFNGAIGMGTTNTTVINLGTAADRWGLDSDDRVLVIHGATTGAAINIESSLPIDSSSIGKRLGSLVFSSTMGQSDAHRQIAGIVSRVAGIAGTYSLQSDLGFFVKAGAGAIEALKLLPTAAMFASGVIVESPSGFRHGPSTTPSWTAGAGTPEGVVVAPIGSLFSRTDGSTGTAFYRKETGAGNTGWIAVGGTVTSVDGRTGVVTLTDKYVDVTGDTMTGALTMPDWASHPVTNAATFVSSAGSGAFIGGPPFSRSWHDVLRFNVTGVPVEETLVGSTWTPRALTTSLFDGTENAATGVIDGTTATAVRWTWNSTFATDMQWLRVAFGYVVPVPSIAIDVEQSNDGVAWTYVINNATYANANAETLWLRTAGVSNTNYSRITIRSTNARPLNINILQWYTHRTGDQGRGVFVEYPYSWNYAKQIAVGGGAPGNGPLTIGTNTTATSGGLWFGNDTVVYRSAAGVLRTPSQLMSSTTATLPGLIVNGTGAWNSLGTDLITNGNFDTNLTGWTSAGGWTWSAGVASHAPGDTNPLTQTIATQAGKYYYVSLNTGGTGTVTLALGSNVSVAMNGGQSGALLLASGANMTLEIRPPTGTAVTVDAVVVKVVNMTEALAKFNGIEMRQSFNSMALTTGPSLRAAQPDENNVAIGCQPLLNLVSGYGNIGIGRDCFINAATMINSVAIGMYAAAGVANFSASGMVAIGVNAMDAPTVGLGGRGCVAVGGSSLRGLTTGSENVALGNEGGKALTTGQQNLFVGFRAGWTCAPAGNFMAAIGAGTEVAGDYNTSLGYGAKASAVTGAATALGSVTTASGVSSTAVGCGVTASGAGSVAIGRAANSTVATATLSDEFVLGTIYHSVKIPGTLSIGANPASYGSIRLPNGERINWRNAANTADVGQIMAQADDNMWVNAEATRQGYLSSGGAAKVGWNSTLFFLLDGVNVSTGTTTGTKWGTGTTQKQSWWNATPVVQNTGWAATAGYTALKSFNPQTATLAETARLLGTLVDALKTYGLLG